MKIKEPIVRNCA